jgi:glutamate dehydrogenase (NAD(P)+)
MTEPLLRTHWTDPVTGVHGWLVLDRVQNGLAGGGIRMRPGLTPAEVESLARVMTRKLRILNFDAGGAKAGIACDPARSDALQILERFLTVHRPFLAETWATSEDLGTHERDILAITERLGLHTSVHAGLMHQPDPAAAGERLARILQLTTSGMSITDAVTGYGVAAATARCLNAFGWESSSVRVAVQGFGTVGGGSAWYLEQLGLRIVAVADRAGLIVKHDGLDVATLLAARNQFGVVDRTALPADYETQRGDEWLEVPADVLIPAAVAGAIHAGNADRVRARLVVEGANLPVTAEADAILHQRGVVVVPDFVANAGGAGVFVAALSNDVGSTAEGVLDYVGHTIGEWTDRILAVARERKSTLRAAAVELTDIG